MTKGYELLQTISCYRKRLFLWSMTPFFLVCSCGVLFFVFDKYYDSSIFIHNKNLFFATAIYTLIPSMMIMYTSDAYITKIMKLFFCFMLEVIEKDYIIQKRLDCINENKGQQTKATEETESTAATEANNS